MNTETDDRPRVEAACDLLSTFVGWSVVPQHTGYGVALLHNKCRGHRDVVGYVNEAPLPELLRAIATHDCGATR